MAEFKYTLKKFTDREGANPIPGYMWINGLLVPTATLRINARINPENGGYADPVTLLDDKNPVVPMANISEIGRIVEVEGTPTPTPFANIDELINFIHELMLPLPIVVNTTIEAGGLATSEGQDILYNLLAPPGYPNSAPSVGFYTKDTYDGGSALSLASLQSDIKIQNDTMIALLEQIRDGLV